MAEKLVRKIFFANQYDLRAMEEYLEEMASKGLMFVKQKNFIFYFKECEPCKLHFSVDVFDKASVFDTCPGEEAEEYIEYCEKVGWHFLFSNGKLQFFFSKEDTPLPIQTDDELKLSLINKYTWKTAGIGWASLLFISFMYFLSLSHNENMVYQFIDFGNTLLLYSALLIFTLIDMGRYLFFYIRNKKRIHKGLEIKYNTKRQMIRYQTIRSIILLIPLSLMLGFIIVDNTIFGIVMCFIILLLVGILLAIEFFRQGNSKLTRLDNVAIIIVASIVVAGFGFLSIIFITLFDGVDQIVYNDFSLSFYSHKSMPLTMNQLGVSDSKYSDNGVYRYSSLFGSHASYEQSYYDKDSENEQAYLEYETVTSSWGKLLDSYVQDILSKTYYDCNDITDKEGTLWNAGTVYSLRDQDDNTEYRLVRYVHQVIFIGCDKIEYNNDNIQLICNTLLND